MILPGAVGAAATLATAATTATLGAVDGSLLGLVQAQEFLFLPPICLAIALVTAAARREDMRTILKQAFRSWVILTLGILAFMLLTTYLFEWILPG